MLKAKPNVSDIRDPYSPGRVSAVVRYPLEAWNRRGELDPDSTEDAITKSITKEKVYQTKKYVYLRQTPPQFNSMQDYANAILGLYENKKAGIPQIYYLAQRITDTSRTARKHLPQSYTPTENARQK